MIPLILLFAVSALAQTAALEGDVKGDDGKPVKDAVVKIERKDMKGSYKTKTDKKGHYFHGGLPPGAIFRVSVEIDGKERDFAEGVRPRLGDPFVVDFDLQKIAARQAALQKAAETGQLTQEQSRELSAEAKANLEKQAKERQAALAKNKELNDAFNQGKEAMTAQNFDLAIEQFTKASTLDAAQHVVWGNLAEAYGAKAGKVTGAEKDELYQKGIAAFQKAVELKPDDAAYHNNFGLMLARAKKIPEAQAELTKAAQVDPASAGKYYYNLGAVLVNTGQQEAAGEAFKKAIEVDPNYAEAHYQLGIILVGKATTDASGKITPPPGTVEAFQKYLELAPEGPNAEGAKAMITSFGQTIETNFVKPGSQKKAPAGKKKQ
ncbi:MAG: tetratricopeptide repeat protein [Bryobacteraceae bacterium]|nr:tetratricopeptide repeat protein [Bryobacteraceae bacterium]